MKSYFGIAAALAFVATALASQASFGQAFPTRPIKIVIPFPAGGMYNAIVRVIGDNAGPRLGQPLVIEHRAGAGGNVGAEAVARSNPDGYTIGVLTAVQSTNAGYYRKTSYDIAKDFVPLVAIGEVPVILLARPDAPFKDVRELIAFAKANPGRLNFGAATSYTVDLLRVEAGIEITIVPYKGASDAITDIMTGRIDLSAGPVPTLGGLVKQGKVRALGIAGPARIKAFPDVPPIGDAIPGYDAGIWLGLFAPAQTPPAIVERLRGALAQSLADPEVRNRLASQGIELGFAQASPAQIEQRIRAEVQKAKSVVAVTRTYAD